jgi:hypothetical protein
MILFATHLPITGWAEEDATKKPEAPSAQGESQENADNRLDQAIAAVKMPGIVINPVERYVDVSATICLDEGLLELIACTKDSKEHESLIVINALPSHMHAALLLLGAKNGNPAMRRPLDKEMTRWVDLPAKGDPIHVSIAWKKEDGTSVEKPLSALVKRSEYENELTEEKKKEKFPDVFLFAGSLLGEANESPRKYYAELSGHVISISTFGDEVLCLPDFHGQQNEALAWQVNEEAVPKRDTAVTLRLRVKKP